MSSLPTAWSAVRHFVRVVLRQIAGDRTTLFFLVVLPVVVIVVIGATFGSAPTIDVGVLRSSDSTEASDAGASRPAIEQLLRDTDGVQLEFFDSADDLRGAVRRQGLSVGLVFADDVETEIAAGRPGITLISDPTSQSAQAAIDIVRAAVAEVLSPADAAAFVSGLTDANPDEATAAALAVQDSMAPVSVSIVDAADVDDRGRSDLSAFSLTAPQNLVLFVFINAMASGASLVRMRRMGVLRRVLAGPVGASHVVLGVSVAWFLVSLLQSLLILGVGALVFGVSWGDPIAAAVLVVAFSAVGAGAGLLVGSLGANEDRVSAISPPVGIVLGALGGCMVPLEIFPESMTTVAKVVPHYWAMTAWQQLVFDGDGLGAIGVPVAVLVGFAAAFGLLATKALHRTLLDG